MRISVVLRLLAACFVVGLIMTLFGWSPEDVYGAALDVSGALFEVVVELFQSAFTGEVLSVFLAGASVILPVAAVVLGVRWIRGRWR